MKTRGDKIKKVIKPWGYELWIHNSDKYCGKLLFIKKDMSTSRHYHEIKEETFYLHAGMVIVRNGRYIHTFLEPGDSYHIETGETHQITAVADSFLFEFSTKHDDKDVYRIK